jgi:two-component system chemotaxis response regulator CheB
VSGDDTVGVLIVDDSKTVRAVLRRLFGAAPGLRVVAEAADGDEAVRAVLDLRPDVVVMDVEMPVLDGFAATERIMSLRPTPIVVLTSRANRDQVRTAFEAMRRGAVELFAKPENTAAWEQLADSLPRAVRAVAKAVPARPRSSEHVRARPLPDAVPRALRYVAIGASTGGPGALRELFAAWPPRPPVAALVVQHIASGFETGLADWLATQAPLDVRVASNGERPAPGTVRIAPSGAHLVLEPDGTLRLDQRTPPRGGHRPSVDELFLSCAAAHAPHPAGVLLSGMGSDGAEGLAALHAAGAMTLVQNEATSVVFGMPRAALARGATTVALAPGEIGATLARSWEGGR